MKDWHEQHPDSMEEKNGSREAWKTLMKTLGPFRHKCASIELSQDTATSTVSKDEDGILFELWALACPDFAEIVQRVRVWISTGSPDSTESSDECF